MVGIVFHDSGYVFLRISYYPHYANSKATLVSSQSVANTQLQERTWRRGDLIPRKISIVIRVNCRQYLDRFKIRQSIREHQIYPPDFWLVR